MSRVSVKAQYRAWWATLDAKQRASLAATGMNPESPQHHGVPLAHRYIETEKDTSADAEGHRDFVNYADWSQRGYDIDHQTARAWQSSRDAGERLMQDKTFTNDEVLDIISKAMSVFTDSVHPAVRLHGTCVKIALGVPGVPNMSELARANNVTRAEVSRRVKNIQKKMGLPPSVYMKSDHACERLKRK